MNYTTYKNNIKKIHRKLKSIHNANQESIKGIGEMAEMLPSYIIANITPERAKVMMDEKIARAWHYTAKLEQFPHLNWVQLTQHCVDCDANVREIGECYVVYESVWAQAQLPIGMLCIGCIEKRLGRVLTSEDFDMKVLMNQVQWKGDGHKSDRLLSRMEYKGN